MRRETTKFEAFERVKIYIFQNYHQLKNGSRCKKILFFVDILKLESLLRVYIKHIPVSFFFL